MGAFVLIIASDQFIKPPHVFRDMNEVTVELQTNHLLVG